MSLRIIYLLIILTILNLRVSFSQSIKTGGKLPGHSSTGYAINVDVKIWYERITPIGESKGTIFLIMGMSGDAMEWPDELIKSFLESGYTVIRYDHRDVGMSDWIDDYYSINDLTRDAIAVLDANGEGKVHVVGLSMGGMIGQKLALEYSNRVNSLALMMTTVYRSPFQFNKTSYTTMLRLFLNDFRYKFNQTEKGRIRRQLAVKQILNIGSDQEIDYKKVSENVFYNIKFRNGYNLAAGQKHLLAVLTSDLRWKDAGKITQPVLVIHGEADPFIPVKFGKKLHKLIKDSDSLFIPAMGHEITDAFIKPVSEEIINHISKSEIIDKEKSCRY